MSVKPIRPTLVETNKEINLNIDDMWKQVEKNVKCQVVRWSEMSFKDQKESIEAINETAMNVAKLGMKKYRKTLDKLAKN